MEIRRTQNPLTLSRDYQVISGYENITPDQFLLEENIVFSRPVILLVNGEPVLRKDWDVPLPVNAVCHFVELPRGGDDSNPLAIVAMVAVMVVAWEVAPYLTGVLGDALGMEVTAAGINLTQSLLTMGGMMLVNLFLGPDAPNAHRDIKKPEDTYNITNGRNILKIGAPFSEHFGRFICFPCLAQANYVEYAGNKQYFYMLGIIGVGEFDIEGVFLDKTPVGDYQEATYNILPPGTSPIIIKNVVWTCGALGGQELMVDWITAVVSAPGTAASYIGFDVVCPAGLSRYDEEGNACNYSVVFQAEIRHVDDFGAALSAWVQVSFTILTSASPTALRRTYKYPVTDGSGRYEFRIRRTNVKSTDAKITDTISLGAVRAYGREHPGYGDVTMIELKIMATEQLNGDVSSKVNVIATRKLYSVTATGFDAVTGLVATRSIVDACAYIITGVNGANMADAMLDFASLSELRTDLETRLNFFDYRFESKTVIMDACATIAKCGRAVPFMPGGMFALVRDEVKVIPSQVYTEDDYTRGSLVLDHIVRTDESPTCIEVEYVDSNTWQAEKVQCVDLGGSLDNPAVVKLLGCTSRQHAFEEGMYRYWDDELNRSTIQFTTGLKGHIPRLGDMVVVSARMTDWGQSGQIAYIDVSEVWITEPVDFRGEPEGQVYLTTPTGDVAGPYIATGSYDSHCLYLGLGTTNTLHDNMEKASKFIFGPLVEDLLRVRILKVLPVSENEVRIEGTIIHDEVHADPGAAPGYPAEPALPALQSVSLDYRGATGGVFDYYALWTGSEDTFRVELDVDDGAGFVILIDNLTAYGQAFTTTADNITVRVTPYVGGVLQTLEALTASYFVPLSVGVPVRVNETDVAAIHISWSAVTGAEEYEVFVQAAGHETSDIITAPTVTADYPLVDFVGIPLCDGVTFKVRALTGGDVGEYSPELVVMPGAPAAVTNPAIVAADSNIVTINWDSIDWSAQLGYDDSYSGQGYVVCRGAVSTFDPATETVEKALIGAPGTVVGFALDTSGTYTYYFRVAAFSMGCTSLADLNFSSVLAVSGVPPDPADLLTSINYIISGINAVISWTGGATDFEVQTPDGTFTHYESKSISVPGKVGDPLTARDVTVTVTPYNAAGTLELGYALSVNILAAEF